MKNSILARDVRVHERARVTHSIIFDGVEIGAGAQLDRCIVDKQVTIPPGEKIRSDRYCDAQRFVTSDNGIVVVPRNYSFTSLVTPEKPKRLFDPPLLLRR